MFWLVHWTGTSQFSGLCLVFRTPCVWLKIKQKGLFSIYSFFIFFFNHPQCGQKDQWYEKYMIFRMLSFFEIQEFGIESTILTPEWVLLANPESDLREVRVYVPKCISAHFYVSTHCWIRAVICSLPTLWFPTKISWGHRKQTDW